MTLRLPKSLLVLLVAIVIVRVAVMTWSAVGRTGGDFYASMPGAYVETFNPALWNSPDMADAWGYQRATYFHGPVQYLTLYPLAAFDSFARIAAVLLPFYAALLVMAFALIWHAAKRLGAANDLCVPLLATTFLYFPLLQAYLQREFEIVVLAALAGALSLLLADRRSAAAALLAYIAWFKYIPLLYGGWLVLRRWWRELLVFGAVSIVILLLTEVLFGFSRFFNNNVPGHAAQVLALWDYGFHFDAATGYLTGQGFCEGWINGQSSLANIRHGLCTLASRHAWLHPSLIYLCLCAATAAVYLHAHARLERVGRPALEPRRRAIELSIVTTICACFVFGHYYYLIVLIIPFNLLLVFYVGGRRYRTCALWAAAYLLISPFVVPATILNRVTGVDVWALFTRHSLCLYGEVLLMGLLLNEYRLLAATFPTGEPVHG